ncbi:MAG: Flp pilus assembly protein CpaB [Geminicoccaceae bacterium]
MGPRRILVLLLALVVAGVTAVYARSWISSQQRPVTIVQASNPVAEDVSEVLVAETSIPSGRFIKPQDIRWQRWPSDDIPENYIVKGDETKDAVIGAVVRRGLFAGQPITDASVVKPGDRGFLAAVLTPGKRAVSVPINATSGNSGLIFPGDRVDLILTQTLDGDTTRRVSETVLPDIRIIAMGVETGDDPKKGKHHEKARTATLEVTPRQAESVALVTELGKLSLSLRSLAKDEEETETVKTASSTDYAPTWDRDVSSVLRSGHGPTNRLLVLRGSHAETVNVEGSN